MLFKEVMAVYKDTQSYVAHKYKMQSYRMLKQVVHIVTKNSKFGRRGVSYTDAKGKVPGRRSRLRPCDKELPEQRSVTIIPVAITNFRKLKILSNVHMM
jgi:hypothetical protein